MQVELNSQLQRQIHILKDKVELIRGNPTGRNEFFNKISDYMLNEINELHLLLTCR